MRLKPFVRVCTMCGEKTDKKQLIRFYKKENQVVFGLEEGCGKGIYLCQNCAKKISNVKMLCKAFRTNISEENGEKLLSKLKEF